MSDLPFRAQVAGLAAMGDIELRGQTYKGAYLASLVAINPQTPVAESARTPQLISEIGVLLAAALYESEMAEVRYRVWREEQVHLYTTDLDAVQEDVQADATKPLSKTAAEGFTRTLPDYVRLSREKAKAAEIHAAIHAAYEGAKARQRAIYNFEHQGGATTTRVADAPVYAADVNEYDTTIPLQQQEAAVSSAPRTPIPKPTTSPPPPPPRSKKQ